MAHATGEVIFMVNVWWGLFTDFACEISQCKFVIANFITRRTPNDIDLQLIKYHKVLLIQIIVDRIYVNKINGNSHIAFINLYLIEPRCSQPPDLTLTIIS